MLYFTRTIKTCGPVALALALSACGEKAAESSAAVDNLTVPQAQSGDASPALLAQASSDSSQSSAPVGPSQSDQIRLTDGNTVISEPIQNSQPDNPAPVVTDRSRPIGENLPVQPEPPAASDGSPYVSIIARTDNGLNTSGTSLVWEAENVETCEASGAWEGSVGANGELSLEHSESGELTYMISCRGAQGTAMATVTVNVESTALAWEPPAQNTNGSEITDLAGYNLYFGTEPGRYNQVRPVRDASQTELELPVEPGTYYLAMTAYDMSGNESELSNEIIRIVN